MEKKTIFLASSSELKEDRDQFEIFIGRKNQLLVKKNIFLELARWEYFFDAMSQTRLQDEYNKTIRDCDIFIMLFYTKVGKYTEEEFEKAFEQFKETNKPLIFTYFKTAPNPTAAMQEESSVEQFRQKLKQLGHFYTTYATADELNYKFNQQLELLSERGFIGTGTGTAHNIHSSTVIQNHSGSGDNVAGDKISH